MTEAPPDHIGWHLWRAAQAWKGAFADGMVAAGHGWFAQARGNLMQHLGPSGLRQSDLARKAGLTKQAVQQFVDELVADGIVTREADPDDSRARRVVLTAAGRAAMQDADRIKAAIAERWRAELGAEAFEALESALRRIASDPGLSRASGP
jgi:DNA-binding MarR family transcriptional regulator